MNILDTPRAKRYLSERPIVEIYKGYEIRRYKDLYSVDASIGLYSRTSNYIDGCYEFVNKLVEEGIKQYDDEAVAKYIFKVRK